MWWVNGGGWGLVLTYVGRGSAGRSSFDVWLRGVFWTGLVEAGAVAGFLISHMYFPHCAGRR